MAISFIGQGTGTTTATLPTHQTGDLLLAFAYRDGSTTAPTIPAGWTTINSGTGGGGTANSYACAYFVATGSGTTSGTWTNATGLIVHVYRGTLTSSPIGVSATLNSISANSSNPIYSGLTLNTTNGSSWVVGFAGHKSVDTALETPPTGMVNRSDRVDTVCEVAGHDTNSGVSTWSNQTVTVGGTGNNWISFTVEIEAGLTSNGSASLSSTSTISATGVGKFLVNSNIAAAGTLSATADVVTTYQGATSIAAAGTTSFIGQIRYNLSSSMSAAGTTSITGKLVAKGTSSISGSGTLSSSATYKAGVTSSLQGAGTLSANAKYTVNVSVSLSESSSLFADPLYVPWSGYRRRITEDGNKRITQDLIYRIVEGKLYEVFASLFASGNINVEAVSFKDDKIYAKINGQWGLVTPHVKRNGVWVIPDSVYVNDGSNWKEVYINGN